MSGARRRADGCVTKKNQCWYAILELQRDSDGRRARRWSRGFETRRQAERALAQLILEDRRERDSHNNVEFVVGEYIRQDQTPQGRRSPKTTQEYWYYHGLLAPLHDRRVDSLDDVTIEKFYAQLRARGLSDTTVHHCHNLLFASLKWARRKNVGLITRNPFEHYDIERPRRSESNAQSLNRAQAKTFLKEVVRSKHARPMVFALASGCRRGEVCGLRWPSVDFHRRVATIRESRYQVRGRTGQKNTKSKRVREVPLNRTAIDVLRIQRKAQTASRKIAGDAWRQSDHVFTDEFGLPLGPMSLTNAFYRCAKRGRLPTTRLHVLRHTAATLMLSSGGNPIAASKILGHSDYSVTLRMYGHVIDADAAAAAASIDRALSGLRRRPDPR